MINYIYISHIFISHLILIYGFSPFVTATLKLTALALLRITISPYCRRPHKY